MSDVNCDYHIEVRDPRPSDINYRPKVKGCISRNVMSGEGRQGNIYEPVPLSDGTNNLSYIDFTGHDPVPESQYIKRIQSGNNYVKMPMTGKKKSKSSNTKGSGSNIKLIYSPVSIDGFSNDTETIQCSMIGEGACVGTMVKDIDIPNGTFDIVTGNNGVTFAINDTTFKPIYRTSGYIKVMCGI